MKRYLLLFGVVYQVEYNPVGRLIRSKKAINTWLLWLLLFVAIWILLRLAPILSRPEYLLSDDFVRYWASGKLNLQGLNPYDPNFIQQMQIELSGSASWSSTISITLTPPWIMPVLMFFGIFTYSTSRLIWLLLSALVIFLASIMLWHSYGGNPKLRGMVVLVALIFAPTISILEKGQITILMLLGLAGFLYFSFMVRNDWIAGSCLMLTTIKPQAVLIFWIALLFWIIQQRRWALLISAVGTTLIMTLIAAVFNAHIIGQYIEMLRTYGISDWATPTIGAYLRLFLLGTEKFWLQFLPSLFGIAWFLYIWFKYKQNWNWFNELPVILFVSVITSPYVWTYDQVILLPAVVQACIWISKDQKWKTVIFFSTSYLALNLLNLLLHMKLDEFWFIWFAPAILLWFLILRGQLVTSPIKMVTSAQSIE